MKADSKIFKGIEYVQVSELPQAQRELLMQTINPDLFIKLLIDGKIIGNCLQYKDYSKWYVESSQGRVQVASQQDAASKVDIKPGLALNKL
jgi:hypothetical protein